VCRSYEVSLARLDDLIPSGRQISLLKIDVEGYELPVLRGADSLLQNTTCVYFESFQKNSARFGYNSSDLHAFLASFGFRIYKRTTDGFVKLRAGHISQICENLVAVREPSVLTERFTVPVTTA
jgi:hypothetical protein